MILVWMTTESILLKHAKLLTEVQSYCEASGARWMNMDYLDTRRWDHYNVQEPLMNAHQPLV